MSLESRGGSVLADVVFKLVSVISPFHLDGFGAGAFVVPSGDYSHGPPLRAGFLPRAGRETETEQQRTKKRP